MDANPNVVYSAGDEANPSANPRCFICYQLIQEPVVLPCHHEMCRECFQRSVETANFNCPVCRKRYSSWARRHSNDPVDKKRKLELHHYYEKFDSLDTLELLLDISGEEEEMVRGTEGCAHSHQEKEMIELDRQTAMKMQEEEDKSFAELERDAVVASELSEQLNHHHKVAPRAQLEEDRKLAEWLDTVFNCDRTRSKENKPTYSSSCKKTKKSNICSPSCSSKPRPPKSVQLSLWFKSCPQ